MKKITHEHILEKARENGAKHGKVAELDFGAGAEWMQEQLIKANPLDALVSLPIDAWQKYKERIKELEEVAVKLYNLVFEPDLIENKCKANDLYYIITKATGLFVGGGDDVTFDRMDLENEMEKGSWLIDPDKDRVYEEDFTYSATSVEHALKVAKAYAEAKCKDQSALCANTYITEMMPVQSKWILDIAEKIGNTPLATEE